MSNEIGHTGLLQYGGIISDDFLREMRGKEAYKRLNEMRLNSPTVGALLFGYEMAIRGMSWEFSSDKENDPRVELLDLAFKNIAGSRNDFISESLGMLWAGFALFEIVYKRDGASWVWDKFAVRGQETVYRWELSDNGEILGFWQAAPPRWAPVLIPIEKLIHFRAKVERNNPEGRSILRNAWTSYYYWKHLSQVEAIGFERDLNGLLKLTMPDGATTDEDDSNSDASKAAVIARNVRNDEQSGLVLPFGWVAELMSGSGQAFGAIDHAIRRYESRILMSVLAQALQIGQDSTGSHALSKDQSDFIVLVTNSIADIIAETFTKQAIPRLLKLNGYDAEGIKLEHTPASEADLTSLSDFLQKCAALLTWSAEDELWLRQRGGLPERDVEQIQADMDAKAQQTTDALAQAKQAQGQSNPTKLTADYLEASGAPDEAARLRMERRWKEALTEYFDAQKKRVMKGAKELR